MRKIEKTPVELFREFDLDRGKLVKEMLEIDKEDPLMAQLREEMSKRNAHRPSDCMYLARQGLQGDIGSGYSIEIPGRLAVDESGNILDVKATKIPWRITKLRDMDK